MATALMATGKAVDVDRRSIGGHRTDRQAAALVPAVMTGRPAGRGKSRPVAPQSAGRALKRASINQPKDDAT